MTHDVHEIGGIAPVEHRERRIEPEPRRIFADEPVADRMEGAGPGQAQIFGHAGRGARFRRQRFGHDPLRAARHLERGPARKGEQQHALGRHAREQQACHAMGERAGLARAGAGDDQQR